MVVLDGELEVNGCHRSDNSDQIQNNKDDSQQFVNLKKAMTPDGAKERVNLKVDTRKWQEAAHDEHKSWSAIPNAFWYFAWYFRRIRRARKGARRVFAEDSADEGERNGGDCPQSCDGGNCPQRNGARALVYESDGVEVGKDCADGTAEDDYSCEGVPDPAVAAQLLVGVAGGVSCDPGCESVGREDSCVDCAAGEGVKKIENAKEEDDYAEHKELNTRTQKGGKEG